eukprot:2584043-Rhodomonas_salina.1
MCHLTSILIREYATTRIGKKEGQRQAREGQVCGWPGTLRYPPIPLLGDSQYSHAALPPIILSPAMPYHKKKWE